MDAPGAVQLAKTDGQPKLEAARRRRSTGCCRPTTHDRHRKGDGVAGPYLQLFDVEGLSGLVIGEEEIPRLLVFSQAARLQRRWHVEHDNVVIMLRQYGRQVMPPDSVCPSLDNCLDLRLSSSLSLRHTLAPLIPPFRA